MRYACTGPLVALVFSVSQPMPAAAANKEHQQLMADMRILQEQSQQLQNTLGTLTEALKAVNTRLDEQASQVDEHANANRRAFADQKLVIDNLSNDVRVVREKVDDNNVRIGSLTQEVDALRQSITQLWVLRLSATGDTEDTSAAGAATQDAATAGSLPVPPVALGASPTRIFDMAYADYTSGQYYLAIEGFEAYLRSFPKTEQAGDAQVYVGDSYLNDGKYDKAADAYEKAIRNYPTGGRISDAYYKKGLALASLKQRDRAREAYEYVVKNYPDSAAAGLARQQLTKLGRP